MMAMMGFTIGTFAQDKNCGCKKRVVHRRTVQHKTTSVPVASDNRIGSSTLIQVEPCFQYRKHNIVVTQCPGTFYDNSDLQGFERESSFTGNYPLPAQQEQLPVKCKVAPEHITIDNYSGVAPAGGNGCNKDCTSR
jgi:hypothetical protein